MDFVVYSLVSVWLYTLHTGEVVSRDIGHAVKGDSSAVSLLSEAISGHKQAGGPPT